MYNKFQDQDVESYDSDTIPGQINHVHILVQPLNDRQFCVEIRSKTHIGHFGPLLLGKQVVHGSIIAKAVRQTAFNADIQCKMHHEKMIEFVSNAEERLKHIRQIGKRFSQII